MKKAVRWLAGILSLGVIFSFAGCKEKIPEGYKKEGELLKREMFGEADEARIYNYCPSVFYEDENTMYAYYCTNTDNGVITDYIAVRKGIKIGGDWYWSEKKIVLYPTENTWDSRHTCDPAVIKGSFTYGGENYAYLMAYLGCVTSDNMRNEVGLAVAKSPEGPFVKCSGINPIEKYPEEYSAWGYGQPSLVSVDKAGKTLLFYTAGLPDKTCEFVERWDFSSLDRPVKEFSAEVTNKGLYQINSNAPETISNADFAYDPQTESFLMIADSHPFDTSHEPSFVSSVARVARLDSEQKGEAVGDIFSDQTARWKYLFEINATLSGYSRNHNCCIIRDAYGWVVDSQKTEVAFTVSELDRPQNSLWTYRIHRYEYTEK
ncbi:MAG: hypothetical protein ACI4SH_06090 [Candidatus Scatosoma sp.]